MAETRITQDEILKKVATLLGRDLSPIENQIAQMAIVVNSAINALTVEKRQAQMTPQSTSADKSTSVEGASIQKL